MSSLLRRLGWCLLAYIGLAWLPWGLSGYHTHVLTTGLYYVILAIGWNLLAGYNGQFSLAHHTFAGLGAYTSAGVSWYTSAWPGCPGCSLATTRTCSPLASTT